MVWFRVDDGLDDHAKVRRLGRDKVAAMGVWLLCGSWASRNLTDGFVPAEIAERHDPKLKMAARLVAVGLWEHAEKDGEPGYSYHDWSDRQPSRADVEKNRRDNAKRQQEFRGRKRSKAAARNGDGTFTAAGDNGRNASPDQPSDEARNALPTDPRNEDRNALRNGASNAVTNGVSNGGCNPAPDPTRPEPLRGYFLEGGAPNERARANPPTRPRCERHQHLPDDDPGPPCFDCRDVRLTAEHAAGDAEQAERQRRAERIAARNACRLCDDSGWRLGPDLTPIEPAVRCDHQALRSAS